MQQLCLLAVAMLLALPLAAEGKPRKGEDAPKFEAGGRIIHPPEFARDLDSCKGKIVVLLEWNRRDASKEWLIDLQPLWKKYGNKSLMIFAIHRLKDTEWLVRSHLRSKNITFPCCMGYFYDDKNDFGAYAGGDGKFSCCVIGLDQKVAYWNTKGSPAAAAEKLLKAVEYQGLERQEIAPSAKTAASAFSSRKFGRALNQAQHIIDGEYKEQEIEDAEYIKDCAQTIADERQSRIDEAKEEGRLDILQANYTALRLEFVGHEIGDNAKQALKDLKKDKKLKKELKAFEQLTKLLKRNETKEPVTQANGLRALATAFRNTKAAQVAKKLATNIDSWNDDDA